MTHSPELAKLEAELRRSGLDGMSFEQVLGTYTKFWYEARDLLNEVHWREGIAGDIELARVLNALPSPKAG